MSRLVADFIFLLMGMAHAEGRTMTEDDIHEGVRFVLAQKEDHRG